MTTFFFTKRWEQGSESHPIAHARTRRCHLLLLLEQDHDYIYILIWHRESPLARRTNEGKQRCVQQVTNGAQRRRHVILVALRLVWTM